MAAEIGDCQMLSDVSLSGNELCELPESFGRLRALSVLRLDGNMLHRLPESIGECVPRSRSSCPPGALRATQSPHRLT